MPKLLIAIVQDQDAAGVVEALRMTDLRVTEIPSRGGFLKARNMMLYIGVEDDQVSEAMNLIEQHCRPRTITVPAELLGGMDASWMPTEVTHGGATVFVVPLDEIRRI